MKNKSRLFFGAMMALVLGITTFSFLYLKQVEIVPKVELLASNRGYSINELIIGSEMTLNPDYQPLKFEAGIDSVIQSDILTRFKENIFETIKMAKEDPNFYFEYVASNGEKMQIGKKTSEKPLIGDTIAINNLGELESGDSIYSFIDSSQVVSNTGYHVDYLEGVDKEDEKNWRWNIDQYFEVEYPKNATASLNIYEVNDYGFFSSQIYNSQESTLYTLFVVSLGSAILLIYVLINNYEYEKNAPFLKMIPFTKIELAVVIYTSVLSLLGIALGFVYMPHVRQEFMLLSDTLQINKELLPLIYDILCFGVTSLFYFSVVCASFYLKSLFKTGIFKSLKTNTYVGVFFSNIKNSMNHTITKMSKPEVYKIIGFLIANNLVCYALYGMGGFGFILLILYILFIVKYGTLKLFDILSDYNKLETKAEAIANGNFESSVSDSGSLFESVSSKLDKVREGFEMAVNEEVKSQNEKNELVTNISHDLKTPLTALQNYAHLLSDTSINEFERNDYIAKVNVYTSRLAEQIEGIFEISKINSGVIDLNPVKLNITEMLKQSIFEFEGELESRNLQFIMPSLDEEISVFMDPEKTHRIFDNLLSNICKYSLEGTRLYLDIENHEESVKISFKNISKNPMNFTEEEITRRFVRGDKARSEVGSGVGLAIVKNLCEIQGGDMNIIIDGDLFKVILCFPKV